MCPIVLRTSRLIAHFCSIQLNTLFLPFPTGCIFFSRAHASCRFIAHIFNNFQICSTLLWSTWVMKTLSNKIRILSNESVSNGKYKVNKPKRCIVFIKHKMLRHLSGVNWRWNALRWLNRWSFMRINLNHCKQCYLLSLLTSTLTLMNIYEWMEIKCLVQHQTNL